MSEVRYVEELDGSWSIITEGHLFWEYSITKEQLVAKIEQMVAVLKTGA
jgi:hypothetical protein